MIQQDNIRDFAVAAFRHYGYIQGHTDKAAADRDVIKAAESTIKHLTVDGDTETVKLVRDIYCRLPSGKLHKNVITDRVNAAAADMSMDPRTVWRKLARARRLFYNYYDRAH